MVMTSYGARIECRLCGTLRHRLVSHLRNEHGLSVVEYRARFPDAPIESERTSDRRRTSRKQGKGLSFIAWINTLETDGSCVICGRRPATFRRTPTDSLACYHQLRLRYLGTE